MSKKTGKRFANVWDALADTTEEAANLTLRSDLMNEIEADASGEIVKRLVNNGQPVEYGQPLFAIRTS